MDPTRFCPHWKNCSARGLQTLGLPRSSAPPCRRQSRRAIASTSCRPMSLGSLMTPLTDRVRQTLRVIPDYPKPGILFQDITPVLRDGALLSEVVLEMSRPFRDSRITHVVGIEARGFILGGAVATALSAGFVPARKPGKLPWERAAEAYDLEYGTDSLEAHRDAWKAGSRVLIVDDVLATGGTARAAGQLARGLGAELVGWSFLLEITGLGGTEKLTDAATHVVARR